MRGDLGAAWAVTWARCTISDWHVQRRGNCQVDFCTESMGQAAVSHSAAGRRSDGRIAARAAARAVGRGGL